MPGFSTTTTCPRTGTSASSGTSERAPIPVQLTTTGAATESSDVTVCAVTVPPRPSYRRSRYSRYTGMLTAGAVYSQPAANPSGRSPGPRTRSWDSISVHAGGAVTSAQTSRPDKWCTPVAGSPASADSTSSPVRAHGEHRSAGPHRPGPQIAPAATDVVADGGSAASTCVCNPASASEMAVVSPATPAPTTTASTSFMPPDRTGPPPPHPHPHPHLDPHLDPDPHPDHG